MQSRLQFSLVEMFLYFVVALFISTSNSRNEVRISRAFRHESVKLERF